MYLGLINLFFLQIVREIDYYRLFIILIIYIYIYIERERERERLHLGLILIELDLYWLNILGSFLDVEEKKCKTHLYFLFI